MKKVILTAKAVRKNTNPTIKRASSVLFVFPAFSISLLLLVIHLAKKSFYTFSILDFILLVFYDTINTINLKNPATIKNINPTTKFSIAIILPLLPFFV